MKTYKSIFGNKLSKITIPIKGYIEYGYDSGKKKHYRIPRKKKKLIKKHLLPNSIMTFKGDAVVLKSKNK